MHRPFPQLGQLHRHAGGVSVRDQSVEAQAEKAERDWEHIWRPILFKEDGTLDVEQLKKEMADFSFMIGEVPRVYSHVTGGLLSKPNYFADTVIAEADDHVSKCVQDHEQELRENLWISHACQFYKAGEKKKGDVWSCEPCGIDFKTDEFEDIVWSSVESKTKALKAALAAEHTFDNPYKDGMCWCPAVGVGQPHDDKCKAARAAMGI